MNPILYILYYFFKVLVRTSTWVYYSKVTVAGQRHHRSRNPCILVTNHPSTLLDPLNTAIEVDAEVNFLANASLFQHPVADWLLSRLYCIPIERYQDTGGKPLNNAASFKQATKFLSGGGCLYVAPEGSSFVERRLRKIKTGTARIAFAAEKANNWQLGLTILPIGLNYSDPTKFRSELLTFFGEPIRVADFREVHEADPVNAVQHLTAAIGEGIGAVIIDCEDGQQDELLHRLETIMQNEKPLPPEQQLRHTQEVLVRLRQWKASNLSEYEAFSKSVFDYFNRINLLKISDLDVAKQQSKRKTLSLAVTSPLFAIGWLSHVLPCFITKKITDAINGDYHWVPTYKFTAGLVLYIVFIWLQTWLVGELAEAYDLGAWVKWAYLLAYIPLGLIAEWWLKTWKRNQQSSVASYLSTNEKEIWGQLRNLRQQIIAISGLSKI